MSPGEKGDRNGNGREEVGAANDGKPRHNPSRRQAAPCAPPFGPGQEIHEEARKEHLRRRGEKLRLMEGKRGVGKAEPRGDEPRALVEDLFSAKMNQHQEGRSHGELEEIDGKIPVPEYLEHQAEKIRVEGGLVEDLLSRPPLPDDRVGPLHIDGGIEPGERKVGIARGIRAQVGDLECQSEGQDRGHPGPAGPSFSFRPVIIGLVRHGFTLLWAFTSQLFHPCGASGVDGENRPLSSGSACFGPCACS